MHLSDTCQHAQDPHNIVWPRKVTLFGASVTPCTYDEAVAAIMRAAACRAPAIASCHAAHAIVTTSNDPLLRRRVRTFEIVTPDGQPVRWALNLLYGTRLADRVYGPELMFRVCRAAAMQRLRVYFYGGTHDTVTKLAHRLAKLIPGLAIAGYEAPPFRELSPQEDRGVIERICASKAQIVFVGLGCPKQDHFAYEHRATFPAVQVCVGAAFDFHAGHKAMAPEWMQRRGLEWLFRLACEPRRLWRRYLTTNAQFLWKLGCALISVRNVMQQRKAWQHCMTSPNPTLPGHTPHSS